MGRYTPVEIVDGQITEPMIDVKYPVAVNMNIPVVQNRINRSTRQLAVDMISEQLDAWSEDLIPAISGTYEVPLNESDLISTKLENYGFPEGAAHGLTIAHSKTFDARTGYVYALSDLFRSGVDYVAILSDIIEKQIEEEDLPTTAPFPGISPNQDYYLTQTELVIYFQAYEFTPGSVGIPYFPIPFEEIRRIICPRGPIGRLLRAD